MFRYSPLQELVLQYKYLGIIIDGSLPFTTNI